MMFESRKLFIGQN